MRLCRSPSFQKENRVTNIHKHSTKIRSDKKGQFSHALFILNCPIPNPGSSWSLHVRLLTRLTAIETRFSLINKKTCFKSSSMDPYFKNSRFVSTFSKIFHPNLWFFAKESHHLGSGFPFSVHLDFVQPSNCDWLSHRQTTTSNSNGGTNFNGSEVLSFLHWMGCCCHKLSWWMVVVGYLNLIFFFKELRIFFKLKVLSSTELEEKNGVDEVSWCAGG